MNRCVTICISIVCIKFYCIGDLKFYISIVYIKFYCIGDLKFYILLYSMYNILLHWLFKNLK